jgi:hypothetical protein
MKTKSLKKIGGEFEINPSTLHGISAFQPSKDLFPYSSGRSALMAILKNVARTNPTRIHIPYYICHSVVNACRFAGFKVSFYELGRDFLFPLDYTENIKTGDTLLTVNYFGFVNDNSILAKIREARADIVTISDQTQSFWTYKQSIADYSFTSLRKHFPIPDGAFVHSHNNLLVNTPSIPINNYYYPKLLGSILKWLKHEDEVYLDFFSDGERILDNDSKITQASLVARYIYENVGFEHIKQLRIKNTQIVYELGEKIGLQFIFDFNNDVIPLNVPVLLNNRDQIRSEMMKYRIFLPIHWPIHEYNTKSSQAKKMALSSLSLIVDHRYGSDDMKLQVNLLSNLKK